MSKVSVIIPTHNAAQFIEQTVQSVLRQTHPDFDVVVVDDGSTDETRRVLAPYENRIRYVYQDNQERSVARNRGMRESSGEYLVFLDSDDVLLPNKLAVQAAALDQCPNVGVVVSGYQYIDAKGTVIREDRPWDRQPDLNLESLLLSGLTPPHAAMIRRAWAERIGGFDTTLAVYGAEDMDFWFRLSLAGCAMSWVPEIVCQYRVHAHNTSRNAKAHYQSLYSVYDKLFANPELPRNVRSLRRDVYTRARLAEAGRLYGQGDLDEGRECLRLALEEDPRLLAETREQLVDLVVAWLQNEWVQDHEDLLGRVLGHELSSPVLPSSLRGKIERNGMKSLFYRAFADKDASAIRRLWAWLAVHDPRWLVDRGGWSIFIRSLRMAANVE